MRHRLIRRRSICGSPLVLIPVAALVGLVAAACGEGPAAPVACGPLPEVTVNAGEKSSVAVCFTDANGDMLSYAATSSNPAVAAASITGTSITVTGVAPGNITVTVTAEDPGGLQAQQSFAVVIPNRAPQPRGTVPGVTVEMTATVDASQYFSEPDGEALTYAASASDVAVASVSVARSTITVTAESKGSATITISASDPGGLSAEQNFMVTVPNRAPVVTDELSDTTLWAGNSVVVNLAGYFEDPDGEVLQYEAETSAPAAATVAVAGDGLTVTALALGEATVTVTARDSEGLAASQDFMVTVGVLTRLTNNSASDLAPTWSPDGSRVAFESRRDGNYEIYVMDADGSDEERLTNNSASDRRPIWSPDGTRSPLSPTATAVGTSTRWTRTEATRSS